MRQGAFGRVVLSLPRRAGVVLLGAAFLASLLLAVGPRTGLYTVRAVLTASMAPAIPAGSAVVSVPVDPTSLRVGDVITYPAPLPPYPSVMHRVRSIWQGPHDTVVHTRGDANVVDDPWAVQLAGRAGKVVLAVPEAGYVLTAFGQPLTRLGLGAALALIFLGASFASIWARSAAAEAGAAPAPPRTVWPPACLHPVVLEAVERSTAPAPVRRVGSPRSVLRPVHLEALLHAGALRPGRGPGRGGRPPHAAPRPMRAGRVASALMALASLWLTAASSPGYTLGAFSSNTTNLATNFVSGAGPSVVGTAPLNGALSISVSTPNGTGPGITATFDQALRTSSVTTATFSISPAVTLSGTPFTFSNGGAAVTLNLGQNLTASQTYTVTLTGGTGGITGTSGMPLANSYTFLFSTGSTLSSTGPVVLSTSPANGATGAALNTAVTVNFSEAIQASSVTNGSTFCLYATGAGCASFVPGTITWGSAPAGSVLTFAPTASLTAFTSYTIFLASSVSDAGGLTLPGSYSASFTTVNVTDTTPPTVVSTVPAYGESKANPDGTLSITFSKAMNQGATEVAFCLYLNSGGGGGRHGGGSGTCASNAVAGTFSWSGNTMVFTPSSPLTASTAYAFTIQANGSAAPAKDGSGNALNPGNTPIVVGSGNDLAGQTSSEYASSFTTAASCGAANGVSPDPSFPGATATY
ncbi:MAG: signal peptidase I, partial [Chloroflexota bacterium]